MSEYEKESELIAYCGIYCRLCDYYTGRIRDSARDLLGIVKKHSELKLFARALFLLLNLIPHFPHSISDSISTTYHDAST